MNDMSSPPFKSTLPPMCNAWIFLNEDHPSGTNYTDPTSMYQRLIEKSLYVANDIINLCFVDIVPTSHTTVPEGSGDGFTLFLDKVTHPESGGEIPTNQNYMEWIVRDAKAQNQDIKVCLTLLYGQGNLLSKIFSDPSNPDKESADAFAANVVTYLKYYNLDGLDIDWEWPLSTETTSDQFKVIFTALGTALKKAGMLLTMAPATDANIDVPTVNDHFDIIAFQMYYSTYLPTMFVQDGVKPDKFAYGAKFESNFQTAENAYQQMQSYGFKAVTMWRLNSDNYVYEQDQQLVLSKLVKGS